ncbi:hypothetical protein WN944_022410 [Citrus x changshan-huyou]|uniref:Uncharacterized protein n=1 Tax=Citrus x changshan-huyou TaxID=2935761 RepID=A0AAP0N0T4_9ROSI
MGIILQEGWRRCGDSVQVLRSSASEFLGYYIIGVLVPLCLLEEEAPLYVQGLTEVPDIWKWEGLRRVSLMSNKTEKLSEIPSDPHLLTLLLQRQVISSFTMLQVLKMFGCGRSSSDREPHQKIAFYLEAVNF